MSGRSKKTQNGKIKSKIKTKNQNSKRVIVPTKTNKNKYSIGRGPAQAASRGIMPGLLGSVGRAVGSMFGPIGGKYGQMGGDWLGKVTGMGAYQVSENSLLTGNVPTFGNGGGTIVAHREYIGDVTGSTGFVNTAYPLNPGLASLFPWLSLSAAQFEEYELLGMLVEFKSTSAVALNSTNTALGTVIMATDYDSYDTTFTTKQQMEAYQFSTSAPPSQSQLHPIECKPKMNVLGTKYLRHGAPPTGADLRFYDVGTFQLATVGMQAAAVIGELWVTYHVRFTKPKIPTPLGANFLGGTATRTQNTTGALTWSSSVVDPDNTLVLAPSSTNVTITAPIVGATWLVTATCTATTLSAGFNLVAGAGCALVATSAPYPTGVCATLDVSSTATLAAGYFTNTATSFTIAASGCTSTAGTMAARFQIAQITSIHVGDDTDIQCKLDDLASQLRGLQTSHARLTNTPVEYVVL